MPSPKESGERELTLDEKKILAYREQVKSLNEALAQELACCERREAENKRLRERLGCAIEELERRHPLGADPLTTAIIRDGRAALERPE